MTEKLIKLRERIFDNQDDALLDFRQALADLHRENGEGAKAVEILEKVVETRGMRYAQSGFFRLRSELALGKAYISVGRMGGAIKLLEGVLKVRDEIEDEIGDQEGIRTAPVWHELAIAYASTGQLESAIQVQEVAVSRFHRLLEKEHPIRQTAEEMLASYYAERAELAGSARSNEAVKPQLGLWARLKQNIYPT